MNDKTKTTLIKEIKDYLKANLNASPLIDWDAKVEFDNKTKKHFIFGVKDKDWHYGPARTWDTLQFCASQDKYMKNPEGIGVFRKALFTEWLEMVPNQKNAIDCQISDSFIDNLMNYIGLGDKNDLPLFGLYEEYVEELKPMAPLMALPMEVDLSLKSIKNSAWATHIFALSISYQPILYDKDYFMYIMNKKKEKRDYEASRDAKMIERVKAGAYND